MVVQDEVLQGKVRRGQLHSGRGAEEESLRRSQSQRSCRNVNPCPMFLLIYLWEKINIESVNVFTQDRKGIMKRSFHHGDFKLYRVERHVSPN